MFPLNLSKSIGSRAGAHALVPHGFEANGSRLPDARLIVDDHDFHARLGTTVEFRLLRTALTDGHIFTNSFPNGCLRTDRQERGRSVRAPSFRRSRVHPGTNQHSAHLNEHLEGGLAKIRPRTIDHGLTSVLVFMRVSAYLLACFS